MTVDRSSSVVNQNVTGASHSTRGHRTLFSPTHRTTPQTTPAGVCDRCGGVDSVHMYSATASTATIPSPSALGTSHEGLARVSVAILHCPLIRLRVSVAPVVAMYGMVELERRWGVLKRDYRAHPCRPVSPSPPSHRFRTSTPRWLKPFWTVHDRNCRRRGVGRVRDASATRIIRCCMWVYI